MKSPKIILPEDAKVCGLVMPISPMGGYPEDHWAVVKSIHEEAIGQAGFRAEIVSDSDEVHVIQKTIVQNLYNKEIILCDISGKNANVMFELGMRLAFDKLVVIVKDEITANPFDTSILEYIPYRKDLRYDDIQEFKEKVAKKIIATHKKFAEEGYSPFIKNFGEFTVPKIHQKEVEPINYVLDEIQLLRKEIRMLSPQPVEAANQKVNALASSEQLFAFEKFILNNRDWIKKNINDPDFDTKLYLEFFKMYPNHKGLVNLKFLLKYLAKYRTTFEGQNPK